MCPINYFIGSEITYGRHLQNAVRQFQFSATFIHNRATSLPIEWKEMLVLVWM
jgi:hypothetical protein